MLPFITASQTVWDSLAQTKKPIMLYGMGLGAEKIMKVLAARGIPVAEIFASDEYVRGHSFAGYRVKTLAEIQTAYADFVIVVAFAFWQQELIDRISALAAQYELYAPHVPVVGEGTFEFAYLDQHETEIQAAYDLLADAESKQVFSTVLNYRLSGKIDDLLNIYSPKMEAYRLIAPQTDDRYLDLGAYDGDTVREVMLAAGGPLQKMTAVEPDPKNYRKLTTFAQTVPQLETIEAAVHDHDGTIAFSGKAGRHSAVSRDGTGIEAAVRSVDSIAGDCAYTILKMDVEGEEAPALAGAKELLSRYAPRLIVSAYHRNEDLFALVNQIHALQPSYRIFLRQHPYIPAWETNIYATAAHSPAR